MPKMQPNLAAPRYIRLSLVLFTVYVTLKACLHCALRLGERCGCLDRSFKCSTELQQGWNKLIVWLHPQSDIYTKSTENVGSFLHTFLHNYLRCPTVIISVDLNKTYHMVVVFRLMVKKRISKGNHVDLAVEQLDSSWMEPQGSAKFWWHKFSRVSSSFVWYASDKGRTDSWNLLVSKVLLHSKPHN